MPLPPSPTELLQLADLNFAECLREHARWSEQGVIEERDGALRTLTGTRFPAGMFNTVFPLGETPREPAAWLERQLAFYAQAQRGCSLYTRELDRELAQVCLDAGLTSTGRAPVMVCDAPLLEPAPDRQLSVEVVVEPAALAPWIEIQASAYPTLGMPERAVLEVMPSPARMLGPHALFLLGRHDGTAAAGGMALFSHGIAGVYWIGVRPEQRKRGLGALITRALTNAAFARGARAVVLQASPMGLPIYEALGYRTITSYPWFMATRSRAQGSPPKS